MTAGIFQSRHFQVQKLAEGVYAIINRDGGWAISNAGIIDLGDRTLVFDTLMTPAAASDLCTAAEELTGRPPTLIVNSHYHNDHIWGNQAFGTADIIATSQTRELIATAGREEVELYRERGPTRLNALQKQVEAEADPARRGQMRLWLGYYEGIVDTMPILEVRLPNLTFTEKMTLHGSQRDVELITYGAGHTASDALLYLPEEQILFMSDLLFVGCHPFIGDGDPDATVRVLNKVKGMAVKVLVPGHGQVGTLDDLVLLQQYIGDLDKMAGKMVEAGDPMETVDEQKMPAAYREWQHGQFFTVNLQFLLQLRA